MNRCVRVLMAVSLAVGGCSGEGDTDPSNGGPGGPGSAPADTPAGTTSSLADARALPTGSPGSWSTFQSGAVDEDVVVDTEGFVWAVGEGGAVRIDPSDLSYALYSAGEGLADTFVLNAEAHPDGSVWFQTMSGVSVWTNGEIVNPSWGSSPPPGIVDGSMWLAEIDDEGRVWFVGHQTVATLDRGQWRVEALETVDTMSAFAVDAEGAAWINGWDGLYRLDQESVERIDLPHEGWNAWDIDAGKSGIWIAATEPTFFDGTTMEEYPGAHGRAISVDQAGGVWMVSEQLFQLVDGAWVGIDVGGWSEAFAVRSPSDVWVAHHLRPSVARVQNGEVTHVEITELTRFNDVGLESDGSGRTYIANMRDGSIEVYQGEGTWTDYPMPPPELAPGWLAGDPGGGLWAATGGGGVAFCDGKSWSIVVDPEALPPGELSALSISAEGMPVIGVLADERVSVARWRGNEFDVVDITDALTYPMPILHIRDITEEGIWIGTSGELIRIEGSTPISIPPGGFTGNMIFDMAVGDDGAVWIAHGNGLDRFKDGEWWSTYSGEDVELPIAYGVDVAPNGAVWAAGYGALRFDGTNWTTFGAEDGVASRTLMSVEAAADGSVWFTTDRSGLARWVPES